MAEQNLRGWLELEQVAIHHSVFRERGKNLRLVFGDQNFGGTNACEFIEQRRERLELGEAEFSGAQIRERKPERALFFTDGREVVRLPVVETEIIKRARAENLRNLAADELSRGDLTDLVADRNAPAGGDQFFHVAPRRMERNPAHRRRSALRQRHIQNRGRREGILPEHFVKIPQPEHQQRSGRQFPPHGVILLHHRRDRFRRHQSVSRNAESGLVAEA